MFARLCDGAAPVSGRKDQQKIRQDHRLGFRTEGFPLNVDGNGRSFGFLVVALLRTAAAVYPHKAAGCDMRSIRYGVDLLARLSELICIFLLCVYVFVFYCFFLMITAV